MTMSEDDAKLLSTVITQVTRDVRNLHSDVAQVLRKVCPGENPAGDRSRGWPPVKSFEEVAVALAWLASGFASIQADVGKMNARLDVVMNDSHAYDEMKAYLKRPPPRDRRRDG